MTASQPPPRSDNPASKRTVLGVCFLLAMVVFIIFGRTRGYWFNFDDNIYFSSKLSRQGRVDPSGRAMGFSDWIRQQWHPLTWLSLMLNVQIFGTGPAGRI